MSLHHAAVTVSFALFASACGMQGGEQQIDFAAEEEAVQNVEMAFLEFGQQRDAAGAATLFTEDATLFREDREPIVGLSAVQVALAEEYEATNPNAVQTSVVDYTEVAPSGDVAFQYGTWTVTGAGDGGTDDDRGRYLSIYRRIDGIWKIAIDMSLSTKPDSATL